MHIVKWDIKISHLHKKESKYTGSAAVVGLFDSQTKCKSSQYTIDILTDDINQKNKPMLNAGDEAVWWKGMKYSWASVWQTDPPSTDESQEYSAGKYGSDADYCCFCFLPHTQTCFSSTALQW